MNPELEALIRAYLAVGECEVHQRKDRLADYETLLEKAWEMLLGFRMKSLQKVFAAAPMLL